MRLLSETIKDGRVLSLIRKYLQSGVMINGVVMETEAYYKEAKKSSLTRRT